MKKTVDKVQIHSYIDKSVSDTFERLYSHCKPRFIQNALELANNDKNFFDRVFYKDIYIGVDKS